MSRVATVVGRFSGFRRLLLLSEGSSSSCSSEKTSRRGTRTGSSLALSSTRFFVPNNNDGRIESVAPISFPASLTVFVRRYKRANRKVSVVLREKTKHLGKKSDVVSVKPGRARNHLIPMKLAKYATEENVEKALREKEEGQEEDEDEDEDEDEEEKVRMFRFIV